VKRISITALSTIKDKKALDEIKLKLDKDHRINIARDVLLQRIISNVGFKQADINLSGLNAFVDSSVENKSVPIGNTLKKEMQLLKVGDLEKSIGDLITYTQTNRFLADGSGLKPFDQLMQEFKQAAILDYYKNHIEDYNEDFRLQMNELKEGNLFFDIMMKEVWNKAQTDSAGQANYYYQHVKKYTWKNSADAIIFYCGNEETAKVLRQALAKKPVEWKRTQEDYSDRSTVDSGRFEWTKIPGLKNAVPKKGMITAIEKNKDDNSAAFAWVVKVYTLPTQKSFNEARGDVISDYQNELDDEWINTLKKKYPVQVDEKVLQSIIK
jgi:peptidyl-prolyl cis-trans isomerase SurA